MSECPNVSGVLIDLIWMLAQAGASPRTHQFIWTSKNLLHFLLGSEETDPENPTVASGSKLLRDLGSGTCARTQLRSDGSFSPIILIMADGAAEAGGGGKGQIRDQRGARTELGMGGEGGTFLQESGSLLCLWVSLAGEGGGWRPHNEGNNGA